MHFTIDNGAFVVTKSNGEKLFFFLVRSVPVRRDGYTYFPFRETIYYRGTRRRFGVGYKDDTVFLLEWHIESPEYYFAMPFQEDELDDLQWSLYNKLETYRSKEMAKCIFMILARMIAHPYSGAAYQQYESLGLAPKHVLKNWESFQKSVSKELYDIFY